VSRRRLVKPRIRRGIVPRPRVDRLLEAGRETALTLVAAPAGYGKTVAVERWLADRPAAWVTVESADNDPVRLWTSVAAACEARVALARLGSPAGIVQPAIDAIADTLDTDGRPFALVLDDLQLIDDSRCLRSIVYAIGVLPANVQLVVLSRTVPDLRLARLRAQGLLTEIGGTNWRSPRRRRGCCSTRSRA
jgi:LuxR family maltose regulon positive regulatory protein